MRLGSMGNNDTTDTYSHIDQTADNRNQSVYENTSNFKSSDEAGITRAQH